MRLRIWKLSFTAVVPRGIASRDNHRWHISRTKPVFSRGKYQNRSRFPSRLSSAFSPDSPFMRCGIDAAASPDTIVIRATPDLEQSSDAFSPYVEHIREPTLQPPGGRSMPANRPSHKARRRSSIFAEQRRIASIVQDQNVATKLLKSLELACCTLVTHVDYAPNSLGIEPKRFQFRARA